MTPHICDIPGYRLPLHLPPSSMFYDEAAQRQTAIDMVNRVLLENQPVEDSLSQAAQAEQAIIDQARQ